MHTREVADRGVVITAHCRKSFQEAFAFRSEGLRATTIVRQRVGGSPEDP